MHRGSCLCGAIRFEIEGELAEPDACHCGQCRKTSGHVWASTDLAESRLKVSGAEGLTWYQSSARVRRGFCSTCGSSLFWKPIDKEVIAVAMGSLDSPTGTHLAKHIFVAEKGDYYEIRDGLPQHLQ